MARRRATIVFAVVLVGTTPLGLAASAAPRPAQTLPDHDSKLAQTRHPFMQWRSVVAISSADVWKVGRLTRRAPGIQHWNGSQWIASTVHVAEGRSALFAVDATSADDVWAVGATYKRGGGPDGSYNLIVHWNGKRWSVMDVPQPDATWPGLDSVIAIAPDDVYASGFYGTGDGAPDTRQTLHWDGQAWTFVDDKARSLLQVGDALSPTDAWAGGRPEWFGHETVRHWNGERWSTVRLPKVGDGSRLNSFSVVGPADAWAVGEEQTAPGTWRDWILQWNGGSWQRSTVTDREAIDVHSVSATGPSDAWISVDGFANPWFLPMGLEHWDGTAWRSVETPADHLNQSGILDIAAISPSDAWAVGYWNDYHSGSLEQHPITLHWDGSVWSEVD
jgi:hypothetical protein